MERKIDNMNRRFLKYLVLTLLGFIIIHPAISQDTAEIMLRYEGDRKRLLEVDGSFYEMEPGKYEVMELPLNSYITVAVQKTFGQYPEFKVNQNLKIKPGFGSITISISQKIACEYLSWLTGERIRYAQGVMTEDTMPGTRISDNYESMFDPQFTHPTYRKGLAVSIDDYVMIHAEVFNFSWDIAYTEWACNNKPDKKLSGSSLY